MKKLLSFFLVCLLTLSLAGCSGVSKEEYDALSAQRDSLSSEKEQLASENEALSAQVESLKKQGYTIEHAGDSAFLVPSSWTIKNVSGSPYYYYDSGSFFYVSTVNAQGVGSSSIMLLAPSLIEGMEQGGLTVGSQKQISIGSTPAVEVDGTMSFSGSSIPVKIICLIQGGYANIFSFAQAGASGGFTGEFAEQADAIIQSITDIS